MELVICVRFVLRSIEGQKLGLPRLLVLRFFEQITYTVLMIDLKEPLECRSAGSDVVRLQIQLPVILFVAELRSTRAIVKLFKRVCFRLSFRATIIRFRLHQEPVRDDNLNWTVWTVLHWIISVEIHAIDNWKRTCYFCSLSRTEVLRSNLESVEWNACVSCRIVLICSVLYFNYLYMIVSYFFQVSLNVEHCLLVWNCFGRRFCIIRAL